jgi:hypothetical protein
MKKSSFLGFLCWLMAAAAFPVWAQWQVFPVFDQRQSRPPKAPATIKPGDKFPGENKFRWVVGELEIPASIKEKNTEGKALGLIVNGGDGGEVWVGDVFQARFDNDHPALVPITGAAVPGEKVRVAIQFYGKVQGGDKFDEANLTIVEPRRATERLALQVRADRDLGPVPDGLIGLSQGGGMCDYEEATARKLREGGFRWFRMDNVFTSVRKTNQQGEVTYDWKDLDKRVDFLHLMGADAILCASYMPQSLDAVPNGERQSAPRDYSAWEELCYLAAKRCLDRERRVAFWEVWNEVNTGWLKPGPQDTGAEAFRLLYSKALGKDAPDPEVVRRFEAYCKLYRATARGVLRADPTAKVGGPALASGPFENSERGHAFHGKGFGRGLMLWCTQEQLPLDFVSWHEYFQSANVFVQEAETFRTWLRDFPNLKVQSYMVTEWNEAWWADRPQDHELGAAWCANTVTRGFIPGRVDRPCFFYAKQNDGNFRGDYSLLMQNNVPKASFNMARIFNGLRGRWVAVEGGDDEVSAVAAWDAAQNRLAVVLVNFRDRHNYPRKVKVAMDAPVPALADGAWRESVVDGTHANVWHDAGRAELTFTHQGAVAGSRWEYEATLAPNSITLLEWVAPKK